MNFKGNKEKSLLQNCGGPKTKPDWLRLTGKLFGIFSRKGKCSSEYAESVFKAADNVYPEQSQNKRKPFIMRTAATTVAAAMIFTLAPEFVQAVSAEDTLLPEQTLFVAENPLPEPTENSIVASASGTKNLTVLPKEPDEEDDGEYTEAGALYIRSRNFSIERDYEQECMIKVTNDTDKPQVFYLNAQNSYEDISLEIIKRGFSESTAIIIAPNETAEVEMSVFAQNAENDVYTIPVDLYVSENGIFSNKGAADITLKCTLPVLNLSWEKISEDASNLEQTYRITNNGELLADVDVFAAESIADYIMFDPAVNNLELNTGAYAEFSVYPNLAKMKKDNISALSGEIIASCAGKQSIQSVVFDTKGQEITVTTMGELALKQDGNPYTKFEVIKDSVKLQKFDGTKYVEVPCDGSAEADQVLDNNNLFDYIIETDVDAGVEDNIHIKAAVKSSSAEKGQAAQNTSPKITVNPDGSINIKVYMTYGKYIEMISSGEPSSIAVYSSRDIDSIAEDVCIDYTIDVIDEMGGTNLGQIKSVIDFVSDTTELAVVNSNPNIPENVKTAYSALYAAKFVMGTLSAFGVGGLAGKIGFYVADIVLGEIQEALIKDYNGGVLTFTFSGGQCTNRGKVSMNFTSPDFHYSSGSSVFKPRVTVSSRLHSEGYVDKENTNYDVYLNGKKYGETSNAGVTDVAFAAIEDADVIPGGENEIVLDYDTRPGNHHVTSDVIVQVTYPHNTPIGFVGDPNSLPDVRPLPDFAVYGENIISGGGSGLNDNPIIWNEPNDFTVYVYNRDSSTGWCDIEVSDEKGVIYKEENVCIEPSGKKIITVNDWVPASTGSQVTVTVKNKTEGKDERNNDNNVAVSNFNVRRRQVPSLSWSSKSASVISDDTNIYAELNITNAADVTDVNFKVDGTAFDGTVSKYNGSKLVYKFFSKSPLTAGEHTLTAEVTYTAAGGESKTKSIDRKITVTDTDEMTYTFSIDETVSNPQFYISKNNGSYSELDVSKNSDGAIYFVRKKDMADNPQNYKIAVIHDSGCVTFTLDKENPVISTSGCNTLSLKEMPGFDNISIDIQSIDGKRIYSDSIKSSSLYLTPGEYEVYISGEYYSEDISKTQTVDLSAAAPEIDPADLFLSYVFTMEDNLSQDYNAKVCWLSDSGKWKEQNIETQYDPSTNKLICFDNDTYFKSKVDDSLGAKLVIYSECELYEYTIKTMTREQIIVPAALSRSSLNKVTISCNNKDYTMENPSISTDAYSIAFYDTTVWIPDGEYTFVAQLDSEKSSAYTVLTQVITEESEVVLGDDVTTTHSGITLSWAEQYDQISSYVSFTAPSGITFTSYNFARGKKYMTEIGNNKISATLSQGDVLFKVLSSVPLQAEGANLYFGNSFSGTLRSSRQTCMAGDKINLYLEDLRDTNGNALDYIYTYGSEKIDAVVTYSNVADSSKIYKFAVEASSENIYSVPVPEEAGEYSISVQLFTDSVGKNCEHSFELKSDENNHWYECIICEFVKDVAEHIPNIPAATETDDKVCTVCRYVIEKALGECEHSYGTEWRSDTQSHWHECSECGEKTDIAEHTPNIPAATETDDKVCTVCRYVIEKAFGECEHSYGTEWKSDTQSHWHECSKCGKKTDIAEHTPNIPAATGTDDKVCTVCSYVIEKALSHTHSYGTEWKFDTESHWHECICGEKADTAAHTPNIAAATEAESKICTECGYVIEPALTHTHVYGSVWAYDSTYHWHECSCGERSEVLFHTENGGIVTSEPTVSLPGVKTYSCSACGYVIRTETIPPTGEVIPAPMPSPAPIYSPVFPAYPVVKPGPQKLVLKAEAVGNSVVLSWDEIDGASEYTVYQYINKKYKAIKTTEDTTVTVGNLKNGKKYQFLVKYKLNGRLSSSAYSGKASATVMFKPIVTAKTSSNSVTLKWASVNDAEKYAVYKYVNGKAVKLIETEKRSVTVKKLVPGKEYSYIVIAYVDGKWTKMKKSDIVTVTAK